MKRGSSVSGNFVALAASSINPRHERGKCGGRWNSVRTACEHRIVYLAAFLRMSRLV